MSHCIYAIIVRTDSVKEEHLKYFKKTDDENFMIISADVAAEYNVDLGLPRVQLNTDYFGGSGEQEATYFDEEGFKTTFGNDTSFGAINSALRMLGVKSKEVIDHFDSIGLDKFRSDADLRIPMVTMTGEQHEELLNTLEDALHWRAIVRSKPRNELNDNDFNLQDAKEIETLVDKALIIARKGTIT